MPNRIVSGSGKRHGAWVNLALKRRICANPCAVCRRPDDIECDHVIGIIDGGKSTEDNLQPLCRTCNVLKRYHKTNAAVARWIEANPERFERSQQFRTERLAAIARGGWL